MKTFDVVGLGALNVDRLGFVDRLAAHGEVVVKNDTRAAGGSAANTIAALGRFGLKTAFVGAVGSDADGKFILEALRQDGVNTSFVSKKNGSSGTAFGLVDEAHQRSLYLSPGVNSQLTTSDVPRADAFTTKFLHISSFCADQQLDVQIQWVREMTKRTRISFAPGMLYAKLGMKRLFPLLKFSFCVFITKEELRLLTNTTEVDGVQMLISTGVEIVIVTKGKDGCTVVTPKNRFDIPPQHTHVVDTTGAGDALAAGFLYGLLHGFHVETSAKIGTMVASYSISAIGGRDGIPSKEEFFREVESMTKIKNVHKNTVDVLIIGAGGREHVLGWKLKQSPRVRTIYFSPGNAGTAQIGTNVAIDVEDVRALAAFAKSKKIELTVVGPEAALAKGVVDAFEKENLKIFGPTEAAAKLETSKAWAVEFMERHGILHPYSKTFDTYASAVDYVRKQNGECVIKADGLALGKGVFVCHSIEAAQAALVEIMVKKSFGSAGERVVIQELLVGREVSAMALSDGAVVVPLIFVQDYKRAHDGDRGPNTGGMGSIAPAPNMTPALTKKIHRLLTLTVEGMREEGMPYKGVLYAGLMIEDNEPYVLEFNCRFGDPETQVQMPLLQSDLFTILEACAEGRLTPELVTWEKNREAVCVVLASYGYPGSYTKGSIINGLDKAERNNSLTVFHAGTKRINDQLLTSGGRVLGITAIADSLENARNNVYSVIGDPIHFEGMQYRRDIGYVKQR